MGYNQKRVLLVGAGENAEAYMEKVAANRNFGFDVIGYIANCASGIKLPYLGGYSQLEEALQRTKPDEVVAALSAEDGSWMAQIIQTCEKDGTKLSVVPFYTKYMPSNPQIDSANGLALIVLYSIFCGMRIMKPVAERIAAKGANGA